ncbi:MAG TPA: GDSL-type esterase/lipase family protein [Gammaproteobacteria bacterium]
MRLYRYVGAVLLAALSACGDSLMFEPLPAGTVVLAFGDSVTYGTGARQGEDYPSRLAELTGWHVRNAGVPGDTAREATERIADAIADTGAAIAIIELGGNDFLQRRSAADVKEDLRTIVRSARDAGVLPVLVSVPQLSVLGAVTGRLSDSPIYAELAAEEGVLLIEDVFAGVLSDVALRSDPIHPNAEGYRVLAARIAEELERAGLLARR